MAQKLYFKHSIINSGDQDAVETEINVFNSGHSRVLGSKHQSAFGRHSVTTYLNSAQG